MANLFTSLATTLADRNPSRLFEMDVLKDVIAVGLEAASNNAHLLVSPRPGVNPQHLGRDASHLICSCSQ